MATFSVEAPHFAQFLTDSAVLNGAPSATGPDHRNAHFICRNFLLDERVGSERAREYAEALPGILDSFADWNAAHNAYLVRRVFLKPPPTHTHRVVRTDDSASCPVCFRSSGALADFEATDLDVHLLRLLPVADLAWLSGANASRILDLGEKVVAHTATRGEEEALTSIFEEAFFGGRCDHRPVFSAFYEDFIDELRDPDDIRWPNHLRDRLGLFHLSQWAGPLPRPVFLFRYPVRDLPRRSDDPTRRPIAIPCVLDHRLNEAFCPAPIQLNRGQVVNLRENAAAPPAREVLHPFLPMEVRHLFRVGSVSEPAPAFLGPARRDHLIWLQLLSDRGDFGALTDSDILA